MLSRRAACDSFGLKTGRTHLEKQIVLSQNEDENPVAGILSPRIYNLSIALRRATNLQAKRSHGLERENWRVLVILGAIQPTTLGGLAERISLDHGHLSREVTALVKKGLVRRRRQWRHVHLSLTPEGERLYRDILIDARERNEHLLEGVPEADRQLVFDVLDRAVIRARELYEREKALEAQENAAEKRKP